MFNSIKRISLSLTLILAAITSYCQSNDNFCSQGSYEIIKPFIGEWLEYTITDSADIYIGKLSTHVKLDGCVLNQSFDAPDLEFSYHSQGFVNPTSKVWEETYVFNSGGYSKFIWVVDGENLYTLRIDGSRKTDHMHRLKYTDVKKDEYIVIQQESVDGGKNWVSKDSTRIIRAKN